MNNTPTPESLELLLTEISEYIHTHTEETAKYSDVMASYIISKVSPLIAKLEAENKELREQNEHLKKLVGIIAKGEK